MYFANATRDIHGYFYYVNFVGNSNNCQIKGLQEIINYLQYFFQFLTKNVSFIDMLCH